MTLCQVNEKDKSPISKFKLPEGTGAPRTGKQIQNFLLTLMRARKFTTCAMCKQNVKKADKTAKINTSCHVAGYASQMRSRW